jgi:hypothetical protein
MLRITRSSSEVFGLRISSMSAALRGVALDRALMARVLLGIDFFAI